jgi:hypothetical protein
MRFWRGTERRKLSSFTVFIDKQMEFHATKALNPDRLTYFNGEFAQETVL